MLRWWHIFLNVQWLHDLPWIWGSCHLRATSSWLQLEQFSRHVGRAHTTTTPGHQTIKVSSMVWKPYRKVEMQTAETPSASSASSIEHIMKVKLSRDPWTTFGQMQPLSISTRVERMPSPHHHCAFAQHLDIKRNSGSHILKMTQNDTKQKAKLSENWMKKGASTASVCKHITLESHNSN